MSQLKIENHNSVTLLNRLRIATRATTFRERKGIFNGLRDALKGLGLVDSKGPVQGIYEGIDSAGNHWFMVDTGDRLPPAGATPHSFTQNGSTPVPPTGPALQADNHTGALRNFKDLQLAIRGLAEVLGNPAIGWSRETSLEAAVVRMATARLKEISSNVERVKSEKANE